MVTRSKARDDDDDVEDEDDDDVEDDDDDDDEEGVTRGEVRTLIAEALAPITSALDKLAPTGKRRSTDRSRVGVRAPTASPREIQEVARQAAAEAVALLNANKPRRPRKTATKPPEREPEPPQRGRWREKAWAK